MIVPQIFAGRPCKTYTFFSCYSCCCWFRHISFMASSVLFGPKSEGRLKIIDFSWPALAFCPHAKALSVPFSGCQERIYHPFGRAMIQLFLWPRTSCLLWADASSIQIFVFVLRWKLMFQFDLCKDFPLFNYIFTADFHFFYFFILLVLFFEDHIDFAMKIVDKEEILCSSKTFFLQVKFGTLHYSTSLKSSNSKQSA